MAGTKLQGIWFFFLFYLCLWLHNTF